MPIDYTYDSARKIINADAHGIVTVSEIVDYLESILSNDIITFGSIEVFSLENATDLIMKYSEVHVFQDLWSRYKKRIGKQVLIIAPNQLSFGLFRMLSTVVEMSDEEAGEAFKILTSRDELESYLK